MSRRRKRLEWLGIGLMHSGTAYLARLLQEFGLDVMHGEPGSQGVVNWELGPPEVQWPQLFMKPHARKAAQYTYSRRIYIMRDPVRCLESLVNTLTLETGLKRRGGLIRSFERLCPLGSISPKSVAEYMLKWHKICLSTEPEVITATEAAPRRLEQFFGRAPRRTPPTKINSRRGKHKKLSGEYLTFTAEDILSEYPKFQSLLDFHQSVS